MTEINDSEESSEESGSEESPEADCSEEQAEEEEDSEESPEADCSEEQAEIVKDSEESLEADCSEEQVEELTEIKDSEKSSEENCSEESPEADCPEEEVEKVEDSEESPEADCPEEEVEKVEDSGESSEANGSEEQVDKVNDSEELSGINEVNDFEESLKANNSMGFCCDEDDPSDEDLSDMDEEGNEVNDFEKSLKANNSVGFCCDEDFPSDEDLSDMDEEGKSSSVDEGIYVNTSLTSKSRKPILENIEEPKDDGMVNADLSEEEGNSSRKRKSRIVRKDNSDSDSVPDDRNPLVKNKDLYDAEDKNSASANNSPKKRQGKGDECNETKDNKIMVAACNGKNELQTEESMKLVIEPDTPVLEVDIIETSQAENETVSWEECTTTDEEECKDVFVKECKPPKAPETETVTECKNADKSVDE